MNCTRVRVRYTPSHLQALAGVGEEEIEVCETPATLESLLRKLLEIHGQELYEQLYDEEKEDLRYGVIVLVNDKVVQKTSEPVRGGDLVVFTVLYEGG